MKKLTLFIFLWLISIGQYSYGAQYGRPDSDISTGNWTATPLWSKLDEETPNDTDYMEHNNVSESWCELGLTDVLDPDIHTNHKVRYRARKFETTGQIPALITFKAALFCGGTQIAEWNRATELTTSWQTFIESLTETQAGNISNYADLRLKFYGDKITLAFYWRYPAVSWAEFEAPDAARGRVIIVE